MKVRALMCRIYRFYRLQSPVMLKALICIQEEEEESLFVSNNIQFIWEFSSSIIIVERRFVQRWKAWKTFTNRRACVKLVFIAKFLKSCSKDRCWIDATLMGSCLPEMDTKTIRNSISLYCHFSNSAFSTFVHGLCNSQLFKKKINK